MDIQKKAAITGGTIGVVYAVLLWIALSDNFKLIFLILLPILGALFGTVIGILYQSYKDNKTLTKP
jgi:uncharacterized membrane protein